MKEPNRRDFIVASGMGVGLLLLQPNAVWGRGRHVKLNPKGELNDVNSTDLRGAITLGCQTMGNVFNADDNNIPFFETQLGKNSWFAFNGAFSEAHVPGRHLNALLFASAVLNIGLDEDVIEKHTQAAIFSYSGKLPIPLNRAVIGGELVNFVPHNLREGFHALYALVKYRGLSEAKVLAERSIAFIFDAWAAKREWEKSLFENSNINLINFPGPDNYISGIARSIGPLVKYFKATGLPQALHLAEILKDKAIEGYFLEDGGFDGDKMGHHTHSVTCVMSSLAQFAELTNDIFLMHRVKAFFDNGLNKIANSIGWCIENSDNNAHPERGESNNTGDILETALIFGKMGYSSYYQKAERILRAHLLPSQLRDISFVHEPINPANEDSKRDVGKRHIGAFGFPAPYGHSAEGLGDPKFNMDIVGGTVGSLCEAYAHIHQLTDAGHRVNLLFDYESSLIKIESPYTHERLRIIIKHFAPVFVRIPEWVEKSKLVVNGTIGYPKFINDYLYIPNPPINRLFSIDFDLPLMDAILNHRTRDIRVRFKGDQIMAMDNFGCELTYFDTF